MESPDKKEEKYDLKRKNVKFFSAGKVIRLFAAVFISLFAAFGILAFVNLTVYPDMGIIDLAKERTAQWRGAKQSDLGHEAIAFELMLDAYAEKGGDISHAMDTLTDEFTSANWAELLEYDVDYFLKHNELSDSIKFNGMLHLTKILYKNGHYDLFKEGYKVLVTRFAENEDFLTIYAELLPMQANFQFDDEEEKEELGRLYELELRRHLKVTAGKVVAAMQDDQVTNLDMLRFVKKLEQTFADASFLAGKGDKFHVQLGSDLSHLFTLIRQKAEASNDGDLTAAVDRVANQLAEQELEFFDV